MSDDLHIGERIGDALLERLNTDLPEGMSEFLDTPDSEPDPNSGALFEAPENVQPQHGPIGGQVQVRRVPGSVWKRRLVFHVECRATATEELSARKAVYPRVVHVERMLGGFKCNGLAHGVYIDGHMPQFKPGEVAHMLVVVQVVVDYQTLINDPTKTQ